MLYHGFASDGRENPSPPRPAEPLQRGRRLHRVAAALGLRSPAAARRRGPRRAGSAVPGMCLGSRKRIPRALRKPHKYGFKLNIYISICLSDLSIYLCIYLSIYRSIYLSIYLSINQSIYIYRERERVMGK